MKQFAILALILVAFFLCAAPADAHPPVFVSGVGYLPASDVDFVTVQTAFGLQVVAVQRNSAFLTGHVGGYGGVGYGTRQFNTVVVDHFGQRFFIDHRGRRHFIR